MSKFDAYFFQELGLWTFNGLLAAKMSPPHPFASGAIEFGFRVPHPPNNLPDWIDVLLIAAIGVAIAIFS